jgi:2-polyprenyl-3-methyl-5-hydroxy-6-metoxy-1,4-benzoquinol methylase
LESVLAGGGLRVFDRAGVVINPFNKRFRLTSYMGVNYILAARKDIEESLPSCD